MANEMLTLSEDIIRSRVNLQHDNLEDVKALSLPGTYHEKVVELGTSLRKFSRLKNLDLSRNAITTLKGLEHLKMLEKLNLYYNGIETMDELKRLRFNVNLKELDLRLNPVTRTEPDYRLYLIHMLPNLQKLDDRGVRDRERQAALVHFSTSQATEMTPHNGNVDPPPKQSHPRADMVRGLAKGVSALDDDDVAVLDLIARTGGDLSRPRPVTGSAAREPNAEEYSLEVLKTMDSEEDDCRMEVDHPDRRGRQQVDDEPRTSYNRKYPNIPAVTVSNSEHGARLDNNLQYQDEAEAYNKFKSHGYFTPHPHPAEVNGESDLSVSQVHTEREAYPNPPRIPTERRRSFGEEEGHRRSNSAPPHRQEMEEIGRHRDDRSFEEFRTSERSAMESKVMDGMLKGDSPHNRELLLKLLDLVDRYWNGSKSLHKNVKFKGLAYSVIDSFSRQMVEGSSEAQDELLRIKDENYRLRKREEMARSTLADSSVNESQLKASLQQAYKDNEALKEHVQKVVKEHRKLQMKLQEQLENQNSAAAASMSTVNQTQLDDMQRQNEILRSEVEMLQIRLKQFGQMQELAGMLQESHKSLVQTNDHLLKEITDTKKRHRSEVEQLNLSYNQLRNTLNISTSGTNRSREHSRASATMYDDGDRSK